MLRLNEESVISYKLDIELKRVLNFKLLIIIYFHVHPKFVLTTDFVIGTEYIHFKFSFIT